MATYKSRFKGSQVDEAVTIANNNLNKGSADTPIFYNEDGYGQAIEKDTVPTVSSVKPLTSGGAYSGLDAVVDYSDIQTSTSLGMSGTPPSQNAVKQYVDTEANLKQDQLYSGYGIDVNGATVSVSDDVFREDEEARLHADLKVDHFGDMSVGNDSEVLELVNEARHSSFDLSKFTVVGSPTITDDGIVSNLDSSNYVRYATADILNGKSWEIIQKVYWDGEVTKYLNVGDFYGYMAISRYKELIFNGYLASDNSQIYINALMSSILNGAGWYYIGIKFDYSTGDYTTLLGKSLDGIVEVRTVTKGTGEQLRYLDNNHYIFNTQGQVDLKYLSITVDGKEVFSGNKTGLDVIKPDNYEVVGSPVISEDGVASGFSASDYVNSTFKVIDLKDKNWKISGKGIAINDTGNVNSFFLNFGSWVNWGRIEAYTNTLRFACKVGDTDSSSGEGIKITLTGVPFNFYWYLEYKNGTYTLAYSSDKETWTSSSWTPDVTNKNLYVMSQNVDALIRFGIAGTGSNYYCSRPIDLNSFKIYADGDLVYQPCLKIPYTQTKDGKKIVDYNYKSRVEDEYTQAGYTIYYTLSDTDYTMATVEEDDIVASLDGVTSYTQRADLSIEQQGTTTSGTTVTFPKAFIDTNYALSIPYSAKTTTGFTAAADGDYIAEGKVSI